MSTQYRAITGINYAGASGRERRIEAGKPVPPDLVERAPWLLARGYVEAVEPEPGPEDSAPNTGEGG